MQVERDAANDRFPVASRRLAHEYHIDKMLDTASAPRKVAAINAAYDVLSDPERRADHDC